MKPTRWITLGALIGSGLMVAAQDVPKRPTRPHGPPPELVKEFDKDNDGKLSDDERKAMREARQAKMEEHRKEILAKYDTDGDGKLNDDERAKARAGRQAEILKKYDLDGDGKLSQEERMKMPKPQRRPGGPGGKAGPGGPRGKGGPGGPGGEGGPRRHRIVRPGDASTPEVPKDEPKAPPAE